ncbi:hypothetical protein INT47_000475 [Mucor saturninus]|uniref:Uncharacterized protein n=1 Tax=Mucor saturninus TaxID=64648 RepID=A0A8H7UV85_9FUNG|nr:hypothetical protein INT47_000475 [Mucor saturninus]
MKLLVCSVTDKSSSCPGKFTRKLVCSGFDKNGEENKYIGLFFDIFPHVRHVCFDDPEFDFHSTLINTPNSEKWNYLEYIGPCFIDFTSNYNACALFYQKTLKHLTVIDTDTESINSELYSKLSLFTSVELLDIKSDKYTFSEAVEYITKSIPGLTSLCYGYSTATNVDNLRAYQPVEVSTITPLPSLQVLTVKALSFESDSFLMYLMTKFPRLETFEINSGMEFVSNNHQFLKKLKLTQNNFSMKVLSQFMAFISDCPVHVVECFYTTLDAAELLNNYFKLRNPENQKTIGFTYSGIEDWEQREVETNSYNSQVSIGINSNPELNFNLLRFNYDSEGAELPHMKVVEKAGREIESLLLCMNRQKYISILVNRNPQMIAIANGGFFNHIITNCTRLKSLSIHAACIISFDPNQFSVTNTFITELILEEVVISEDTLLHISRMLPSLTKLDMKGVYLNDNNEKNTVSKFNRTIDMPSTSFESLFVQNYLLEDACSSDYPNKILIKISTTDNTEYYKFVPNENVKFADNSLDEQYDYNPKPKDATFYLSTQVSEKDYNIESGDASYFNLHVICKSFTLLKVHLEIVSSVLACLVSGQPAMCKTNTVVAI